MRRFRDAIKGRFVSREEAAASPSTTVAETVSGDAKTIAALRWRIATLEAVMLEEAGTLRHGRMRVGDVADRLEACARGRAPEEDA